MEDDLNILFIGPSQNGKSTFINKLRELSDYEAGQEEALVGDGSQSCTKSCREYVVRFRRTRYKLVDRETLEPVIFSEDDESHLFRKIWKKKTADDYDIVPIESNPRTVTLRLIDTPGLDDSHGSDDRNIIEVMKHLKILSEAGEGCNHVTAVVLVLNSKESFSKKIQEIYRYYQSCMPNLFGGLAVINTGFSVEKWLQAYNNLQARPEASIKRKILKSAPADSARIAIMRKRREVFSEIFGHDARHFYIDSVPDDYLIVEELITRNRIYDIINYFASQNPMPIQNIKLVKNGTMIQIDEMLATWLKDAKFRLGQREKELLDLADASGKLLAAKTKKARSLESEIEQLKKELALIDNDSRFTIRTHSTAPLHKLSATKSFFKWVVRSSIKDTLIVQEPQHPGFTVEAPNNPPYSEWTSRTWNTDATRWTGAYRASPGEVPNLEAVVSVSNRIYHKKAIADLDKRLLQAKEDKIVVEEEQSFFSSYEAAKPVDPELKEISELLSQCDTLINQLCLDWSSISSGMDDVHLERYKKVRIKGLESLSVEDLLEFIKSQGYNLLERKIRNLEKFGQ
ncbi:hypothetical protein TWF481_000290 [Arthrobotrys musiformis]|uniref:G domain-containing protein n=1 Tax=Arthrobotrys musiformis TaxID=47236 RepID=A0AAV9WMI8_9PEZI